MQQKAQALKKQLENKQPPKSVILKFELRTTGFVKEVFNSEFTELCTHMMEVREKSS